MFSAAFGHSFCITTRMPKPSLAMISADSGLTDEAKKRSSGCEIGRGRIEVRGFGKARPGLTHRNAEALIFDARRSPAKAEQAAPAAQYVEERDLLGDA